MKGLNWDDIWSAFFLGLAICVVILIFTEITSNKYVDGYYFSAGAANTCVKSHWAWNQDQVAFCSDDYLKALDFAARANKLVRK